MTKFPFNRKGEIFNGLLIHTDVYGPLFIHARGGFICFITFVNDYS